MVKFLIILHSALLIGSCLAQQNPETGTIVWGRDYDEGVKKSQSTGKPIFLLFQEVPGCKGCRDFGAEVLSNPLIKKAVEESFIPVMIKNTTASGHDKEILQKFKEPAWNYQVVRFINKRGKDIIPRKDKVWDGKTLSERMIKVLKKEKRAIPPSLDLAYLESDEVNHEIVAFSMFCFWTGEAELGKINGVISTEAGWLDGGEVTLVKYHKKTLLLEALIKEARKVKCANAVYLPKKAKRPEGIKGLQYRVFSDSYRPAKESDQKRQLQGLGINASAFTPAQLTKVNAYVRSDRKKAKDFL